METLIIKNASKTSFDFDRKPVVDLPSSTYRVQLNHLFTFKDLLVRIPYLYQLGISTIYAAPITKASKDSSHGYDVTDFSQINPQIGTLEELKELAQMLKRYNMTWIQDIVPNHMAFSNENDRLMDVLERGYHSPYYTFFDINWKHPDSNEKILIPTLGDTIDAVIQAGDLTLACTDSGFVIRYADTVYPLSVAAFNPLINVLDVKKDNRSLAEEIKSFQTQCANVSLVDFTNLKRDFFIKIANDKNYSSEIESLAKEVNTNKDLLKSVLSEQFYTFVHWKMADTKMNYRRFFTVNSLICLRMEDESVFNEYHTFIEFLYKENLIQGVRVDHIDGLYNPKIYLQRLRNLLGDTCYIIAEKILEYNEDFARDWNIEGTSGYEFLSFTNRVLTDQAGAEKIRSNYFEFTQQHADYNTMVFEKKHTFLYDHMQGELDNLIVMAHSLNLIPLETDETIFRKGLGVFMSAFPIYRIYPNQFPLSSEENAVIEKAYTTAVHHEPDLTETFRLIRSFFVDEEKTSQQKLSFITRLMQFTGPLAAKGVEDTTFYVYNPLISHNEVGDAPGELGISIDSFHNKMTSRLHNNPYSLNATSTHDTKRGEDARMRINVLSHFSEEWISHLNQWHEINKAFIKNINNTNAPSLNDEYFIYQSLLGSFPESLTIDDVYIDRTKNFLLKALKEAKVHTTYTEANEAYENSCIEFVSSILNIQHDFLKTFTPFAKKIIHYGAIYSLAQTAIKITAPGIPDIYQGCELWDTSYVDPDNRRDVDYTFRNDLVTKLASLENDRPALLNYITENRLLGAEKLFLVKELLHVRDELQDVFLYGSYIPLMVTSPDDKKVIAYLRSYQEQHVLVVIPVGFDFTDGTYSSSAWDNVLLQMPDDVHYKWLNIFTAETHPILNCCTIAEICKDFPIAVFKNI